MYFLSPEEAVSKETELASLERDIKDSRLECEKQKHEYERLSNIIISSQQHQKLMTPDSLVSSSVNTAQNMLPQLEQAIINEGLTRDLLGATVDAVANTTFITQLRELYGAMTENQ